MPTELYREQVPQMIELYHQGKEPWEISKILGIHHQTISDYLKRDGIMLPKQRKRTEAKIYMSDAAFLRTSLTRGDQVKCTISEYIKGDDRVFVPITRKRRITNVLPHGVTVDHSRKGIQYIFVPYADILSISQNGGRHD